MQRITTLQIYLTLCVSICLLSCDDDQCFEYFYFTFPTENSLITEEIQLGESFTLRIEIPFNSVAHDGSQHDISDREFITAITFKEFFSTLLDAGRQQPALDAFDHSLLQGTQIPATYAVLAWDTETHSVYCTPTNTTNTRIIELEITPLREGTFFLFLQSANEIPEEEGQHLDDDDCFDSVVYGYSNTTRNDYSFLEGEIQNPQTNDGSFLEDWSGIAFKVTE